ncbi:unnamed protein product [Clavelina lepadiformis]|uniref:BTB domain-containing protein n=1 Tax=Clavelina lepadiformis TaxID=159417 RepID=A0ABP0EVG4_CLALP
MADKVAISHEQNLALKLLEQKNTGKYCDVSIRIDNKRFLAHKCVLSASSSKLDFLMLEAIGQGSSSQDLEVEIKGISPLGFEILLDYFYMGKLNVQPHNILPVYMTAAYFELHGVVEHCNNYFQYSVVSSPLGFKPDNQSLSSINPMKNITVGMDGDEAVDNVDECTTTVETSSPYGPSCILEIALNDPTVCDENSGSTLEEYMDMHNLAGEVKLLRQQQKKLKRLLARRSSMKQKNVGLMKAREKLIAARKKRKPAGTSSHPSKQEIESMLGKQDVRKEQNLSSSRCNDVEVITILTSSGEDEIFAANESAKSGPDENSGDDIYVQSLYEKYSILREAPIKTTCSIDTLLATRKTRKNKLKVQTTFSSILNQVLEATEIEDPFDPNIEDASSLVMDRFELLRKHFFNPKVKNKVMNRLKQATTNRRSKTRKGKGKARSSKEGS